MVTLLEGLRAGNIIRKKCSLIEERRTEKKAVCKGVYNGNSICLRHEI